MPLHDDRPPRRPALRTVITLALVAGAVWAVEGATRTLALVKQQTFIGPWETFTAIEQEDGTTHHNRYLQALDAAGGWRLKQQAFVGPWEKFTVVPQ
jgi:hypothetical protein